MRFMLLSSLFVAGAMAMPGHNVPRSDIAVPLPSSSSVTPTASETSLPTPSSTETSSNTWQSADLYQWTKFFVSMYSSNSTILQYLPTVAGIGDCVLDASDTASCDAHVVKPLVKAARTGIVNFYKKQEKLHANFYKRVTQLKSEAVGFVTDFTHYGISNSNTGVYSGLTSMAMKLLNPATLRSSLSSAWTRFKSVGLSFDSGLLVATRSNVTAAFQTADTSKEAWHKTGVYLKKAALNGLAASAVNLAWVLDEVFIVKASDVNTQKAEDMSLSVLGDDARTCDGNGTCYFFIIAQKISNLNKNKWVVAKGLDKIENYNITLLEFAKSAEWYQDQFGGYLPTPNATAILKSLQSNATRPSLSYFVNMPVVKYDSSSQTSLNQSSTQTNSTEEVFLNALAREVNTLKGWPYSSM